MCCDGERCVVYCDGERCVVCCEGEDVWCVVMVRMRGVL